MRITFSYRKQSLFIKQEAFRSSTESSRDPAGEFYKHCWEFSFLVYGTAEWICILPSIVHNGPWLQIVLWAIANWQGP